VTNHTRSRWIYLIIGVLVAMAAAGIAYNVGVSQGAAGMAALQNATPPPAGAYPYPYAYGWHRPWGFGFGPFFIILALIFLFRGACWGGPWRRRYYYDDRDRVREGPPADDTRRG
jgi:hypothetical protein